MDVVATWSQTQPRTARAKPPAPSRSAVTRGCDAGRPARGRSR